MSSELDRERELQRRVKVALEHRGHLPSDQLELMREDLRLQVCFPGQYAAYQDRWKSHEGRLALSRTVLASDKNLLQMREKLCDRLRELSLSIDENDVEQQYIESPDAGIPERSLVGS